ncbi:hypothetical protein PRECH8_28430 [Insulibacter thermoxylanivorax]|uniref:Uncharacterized protein n=1 Tax=Insulibacter thermoxylanivorax TaxID=2749268 RepID=A0A916VGL3_9BACL|nr:hypothetical protein PRECH8_28430 [Insulibacter thermoxylanivorax]
MAVAAFEYQLEMALGEGKQMPLGGGVDIQKVQMDGLGHEKRLLGSLLYVSFRGASFQYLQTIFCISLTNIVTITQLSHLEN